MFRAERHSGQHAVYQTTVLDADQDTVRAEVRDVLNSVKILFAYTVGDVTGSAGGTPELVPSRYEFTMLQNTAGNSWSPTMPCRKPPGR
jgi:hypothetical protein